MSEVSYEPLLIFLQKIFYLYVVGIAMIKSGCAGFNWKNDMKLDMSISWLETGDHVKLSLTV